MLEKKCWNVYWNYASKEKLLIKLLFFRKKSFWKYGSNRPNIFFLTWIKLLSFLFKFKWNYIILYIVTHWQASLNMIWYDRTILQLQRWESGVILRKKVISDKIRYRNKCIFASCANGPHFSFLRVVLASLI